MKRHLKPALWNKRRNVFGRAICESNTCACRTCRKCTWFSYSCFWEALFSFQWGQLRDDCCAQWLTGDTWCSTEEHLFISFVSAGHRLIPINGSNLEVRDFPPTLMFNHCRMLVYLTEIAQNTGKPKGEVFPDNWQDVWMDRSCSCTFVCAKNHFKPIQKTYQVQGTRDTPETVYHSPICTPSYWGSLAVTLAHTLLQDFGVPVKGFHCFCTINGK